MKNIIVNHICGHTQTHIVGDAATDYTVEYMSKKECPLCAHEIFLTQIIDKMENLHTQETIQEKGEVLYTHSDAQGSLTIMAYDGSLLYDAPNDFEVFEDTIETRMEVFEELLGWAKKYPSDTFNMGEIIGNIHEHPHLIDGNENV